jgi:DNA-binding PadR family transcriptional regulator
MVAVLADTEAHIERTIAAAKSSEGPWRERIRTGLWILLNLAASEPVLAWSCLCEFRSADGPLAHEWQRIVARLGNAVDEGRMQSGARPVAGPLTAEALVGAVAAVLARRVAEAEGKPLRDLPPQLLGELMSMIVLPYLGAGAARRELQLPLPATGATLALDDALSHSPDPLAGISVRMTYRTARVLQATAELADSAGASNRQIAEHAGVADAGQISKLLARLERHGLVANATKDAQVRGEANSWRLTERGRQLARGIGVEIREGRVEARQGGVKADPGGIEARRRTELQPQAKEPSVGRSATRRGGSRKRDKERGLT